MYCWCVMLGMWIVVLYMCGFELRYCIGVVRTIVYVNCFVDIYIYNYMQWYYNPVSHPSAVVKCSMRHCRLDAGGLVKIKSSFLLSVCRLWYVAPDSREMVMYHMYVMTFGWCLDDLYHYKLMFFEKIQL